MIRAIINGTEKAPLNPEEEPDGFAPEPAGVVVPETVSCGGCVPVPAESEETG